jgi:hypothetical protein
MKFTLGKPAQVFTMALVWAASLFALDYSKHPRPLYVLFGMEREGFGDAARRTNLTITLCVNHLCCSGCLDDLRAALHPLTWADKVDLQKDSLTRQAVNQRERSLNDFSNRVQIEIKAEDIARVDFVALDRAVRDAGLVAEHIQFGGIPHVRLEARLPHLCCNMCKLAVEEDLKIARQPWAGSDFKWLDSINVDRQQKTVTAYTRYGSIVDVGEFIAALNHLGFAPAALTVSREN